MKRKLSLLMVLMMMLSLVPMTSFAALADVVSPVIVTPVPNISGATGAIVRAESYVEIKLSDVLTGSPVDITGDTIILQFDDGAAVEAVSNGGTGGTELLAADGVNRAGNRVVITLPAGPPVDSADIYVYVKTADTAGKKIMEVDYNGAFSTLLYAEVSGVSADASLTQSKRTVSRGVDKLGAGFVVRRPDGDTVTLELPRGFEWASTTRVVVGGVVASTTVGTGSLDYDGRVLTVEKTGTNELSSVNFKTAEITVIPRFDVTRDARLGEVSVRIDSDDVRADLVIAEYKDYGVTAEVTKVQEIVAGKDETSRDYIVEVTLSGIAGSITLDREIEMNFNNGKAKLLSVPSSIAGQYVEVDGNDEDSSGTVYSATGDYFNLLSFEAKDDEEIELEFYVKGDWNAGGENLTVDINGRDIDEKGLVLAEISAPVTLEAEESTDVRIGVQRQATSDIVITETAAGSLTEGEYLINFSDDSRFAGVYFNSGITIEATEGDLDFDYTVNRNGFIVLDVNRESRTATKLVVSGVSVSLDRTLPEGPLDARFGADFNGSRLDKGTIVEFPYLNVTNAAPGTGTVRPTTMFTIGQATYTVAGETKTLDAAPYISNNRTMLPIGAVAEVLGATVNYSPVTRTAIFTAEGMTVSMNLDTNILIVNGVPVPMDAKPEIVNARAFVPVVFVAQAFGVQNGTDIVYNAATQQVTLFPAN